MKEIKKLIKMIFTVIIVLFGLIFNNIVNAFTIDNEVLNESSLVSYNNLSEFVTDKNDSIILSYTYNGDNRISIESIYESSEVNLTLSSVDNQGNFTININVIKIGEVVVKINIVGNSDDVIYSILINIYSTIEYNYTSQNSMECAKRLFLVNNYANVDFSSYSEFIYGNNINVTKIDNDYMLLNSGVNEIELNNLNNKTIVKLLLEWKDRSSVLHPVKNIKVEILYSGQTIETQYTNNEGVCIFSIDNLLFGQGNSLDLSFKIISENEYIRLVSNIGDDSTLYSRTTDLVEVIKNDSTNSFSFIADYASSDYENSIQIHQMLNMMGEYVYRIKDEKLPQIQVKYPHTGCSFARDHINIRQTAHDDWDAVMHEYGHYIVYYYDLFETFPTGKHSPSQNLIVSYGKSKGTRLAWSEAVATFFAISAQYLIDDSVPKIPDVRDNNYRSDVAKDKKLKVDYLDGEGSEFCTVGLLLSLADNQSDDCFSSEVVNYEYLFNLIIDNKIETLNEFITCLYNENILPTYEYGEILSYFKVAPNISIENDEMTSFPNAITLSWEAQGGRGDSNDTFNIYILDKEHDIISTYLNIRSTTYSITGDNLVDIINHIIENENSKIYIQVEGFATSAPITGGYFSSLKEIEVITNSYTLSNYTAQVNDTITIDANSSKYYMINSNYNKYYEFMVDGTYGVDIKLFDENFNEILVDDLKESNSLVHIINQLQIGTYYLEIKNNSSYTNSISIKIVSRTTIYLGCGDNDILVNTYNNIDEYNFINSWGAGFYKFTVDAIMSNDFIITYPNETLKIYDNNNEYQEDKYIVEGYSQDAENLSGANYLYMYLERDGYYYIHIDLPNLDYSDVILNIERVSVDEIDVGGRCDEEFIELLVNSNNMTEYAVGFSIDQTATFDLTATTSETYSGNITLVLFRKEYNSNTQSYYKTDILGDYLSIVNERLILEEGTYYIGFFGNTNNVSVTVTIDRIVVTSEIIDQVLVMDPSYALPYGTEVRHNGGILDGTTITEGFTRHVHFQNIAGVPSVERKDYNFYSSNTSYATVSEFGTVFAKSVSQDCEVTITAVYKYNPAIIFTIDLVIKNDTTNTSKVIESTQTIKLSDFVDGKYKLLLYEQNSPYPWIQYFNWSIFVPCQETEILVTMDQYGFLTTSGTGSAILTGEYIINPNVTIVINIIFK